MVLGELMKVFIFTISITQIILVFSKAEAIPAYRRMFHAQYEYAVTCSLCHEDGGGSRRTNFGRDFEKAGATLHSFLFIEKKDSDGDGVLNLDEIKVKSNPGDERSTPTNQGKWLEGAGEIPIPKSILKKVFPDVDGFAGVEGGLNDSQVGFVEKTLEQSLSDADKVPTFYFGIKANQRIGVAQLIPFKTAKGKVLMAVALNAQGKIINVSVIDSPKGMMDVSPLIKQIIGKDLTSPMKIGSDLPPLPGEPTLSESLVSSVKRAMLIMQAVFSKKG